LILEADDHYNVGLNLIVLEGNRPLKRTLHYYYEMQPVDRQYLRHDRISKPLKVGKSVSVVMRKELIKDERLNVVDIDIIESEEQDTLGPKIRAATDSISEFTFHGKN